MACFAVAAPILVIDIAYVGCETKVNDKMKSERNTFPPLDSPTFHQNVALRGRKITNIGSRSLAVGNEYLTKYRTKTFAVCCNFQLGFE